MAATHQMVGGLLLAAAGAAEAQQPAYVNVTAGGPLRPGVYGRIEARNAPPPPLLSSRPLVASGELGPSRLDPVYLYVPAGQVRRWSRYCDRYDACERPVYFVRMDNAPFKLGSWKQRSKAAARADEPAAGADSPF